MGQCTLVLPGALFSPSPKKYKIISPEKIFLIFWEIRFKNLYFLNAPLPLYFGKWNFWFQA